jgi:hypothetical protein
MIPELFEEDPMTENLYQRLRQWGMSGHVKDVDRIMQVLLVFEDLPTIKTADFALDLVRTTEGRQQIRYYLFNGRKRQRNYAALWLKRRGERHSVVRAYRSGLIDERQAFAK